MSVAVASGGATVLPKAQISGDQVDKMDIEASSDDLYTRLKTLQRQLEFLEIQVSISHLLQFLLSHQKYPVIALQSLFPDHQNLGRVV
jgi:hypothetical protein